MEIEATLRNEIKRALKSLGIESDSISIEHPADFNHGDYSTNVALVYSKNVQKNPRDLAQLIVEELKKQNINEIQKIETAGPGFINFHLTPGVFVNYILNVAKTGITGMSFLEQEKILFEYTQPNPFKEFHIGHLMNNMIGESISRIVEKTGAEVKRATYHGDVGLHVAKSLWGIKKLGLKDFSVKEMGQAYATGHTAYEDDEAAKKEIIEINKRVYDKSDDEINVLYEKGRKISLNYFNEIYKKLGSTFDFNFYESQSAPLGKEIVEKNIDNGIFQKSEGAVVFKGEDVGLHTRVFLTKDGIPTYEAKDLGLVELKEHEYNFTKSITITANEQSEYFKVVKKAIETISPKLKDKIFHLSHGMLKLPSGKMSSRTGTIISAESLIGEIEDKVKEKIKDRDFNSELQKEVIGYVSLAALRYSILRQAIGGDIIFDFEKSVSFEGDSGPYLQYSCVRALSVVDKAGEHGKEGKITSPELVTDLEKMLTWYAEIVERAGKEYAPHYLATYLIELAGEFNTYYAHNKIIDAGDPLSPYKVELTKAFAQTMKDGLYLLGIEVPSKM